MVCSARDINAQPHINVTQGQPLAGCSGRVDNLRPPVMTWANQNAIDPTKTYVLRAARILEPATGQIVRGGSLVVRGACIVGVNAPLPDRAETIDLGDVTEPWIGPASLFRCGRSCGSCDCHRVGSMPGNDCSMPVRLTINRPVRTRRPID